MHSGDAESRWYSLARLMFGAGPQTIYAFLWLPFLARAYHLRINGPADQYIVEHALLYRHQQQGRSSEYRPIDARIFPPGSQVDIRIEEPTGVPYSHLYVRGLATEPPTTRLLSVVRYTEVPPGVLGMAALASSLMTIFIVGFTILSPGHPALKEPTVALPGFLLTFLAVLISWLGFTADRESVLRASMTARGGLVGVISVLLVSVLLYANDWINKPTWTLAFFGGAWQWNQLNVWWVVLSIVAILLTKALLMVFIVRTLRYMRIIKKRNLDYVS